MNEVIVALITCISSLAGAYIASRAQHEKTINQVNTSIALIQKDIQGLEKKQDLHNSVIERMYGVERSINLLDERIKVANHRIEDLERSNETHE